MQPDELIYLLREAMWLMVLVSVPPLATSLVVGLGMSLFQAVTQIQETTLSVVPKLAAALASLFIAGPWIAAHLLRFTQHAMSLLEGVSL